MWLLDARKLTLHQFEGDDVPPYVILSHRWQDNELTFDDMRHSAYNAPQFGGSRYKMSKCCRNAIAAGFDYVWIDTCCIDKSSSAELSEAINSMFKWYRRAQYCVVFMYDVDVSYPVWQTQFVKSIWFSRGWTLQELLAPRKIVFVDRNWMELGTRLQLLDHISVATKISQQHLEDFRFASVAEKFSWMAQRETKRPEDKTYSLLGIFNVNMPLLYGEGGQKAFFRLQLEIIQSTMDHSMFVWTRRAIDEKNGSILAPEVERFKDSTNIMVVAPITGLAPYYMTNLGLCMKLRLYLQSETDVGPGERVWMAPLNCEKKPPGQEYWDRVALLLIERIDTKQYGPDPKPKLLCQNAILRPWSGLEVGKPERTEVFICCRKPTDVDDW